MKSENKKPENKITNLQKNGIPIFFFRDEQKKSPSVSLTMMLISFALCVLSTIGKFFKMTQVVDIENSMQLLMITSSLYFGRSLGKKKKTEDNESDN
jgi:hypothetical protein